MPGYLRPREALRLLVAFVVALILLRIANIGADSLLYGEARTDAQRAAGVVVAIVGWIPMIVLVGYSIRLGDEYQRRVFLIGLALAFAGMLLLIIAIGAMQTSGLMAADVHPPYLMGLVAMWMLGTAASFAYHRMRG